MALIKDSAVVIRSKNAGPFELTFDLIFPDEASFVRAIPAITKEKVAALYHIPVENVLGIIDFAPAYAIKITIIRPSASGNIGETDVYGAQQHAPLFNLEY